MTVLSKNPLRGLYQYIMYHVGISVFMCIFLSNNFLCRLFIDFYNNYTISPYIFQKIHAI